MRLTERKLRALIRSVIKESYDFPEEGGIELLEKLFMYMLPVGSSMQLPASGETLLMDKIKSKFNEKCGTCKTCKISDVVKTRNENGDPDGGATFTVSGDHGLCTMVLFMDRFSARGPSILPREEYNSMRGVS